MDRTQLHGRYALQRATVSLGGKKVLLNEGRSPGSSGYVISILAVMQLTLSKHLFQVFNWSRRREVRASEPSGAGAREWERSSVLTPAIIGYLCLPDVLFRSTVK